MDISVRNGDTITTYEDIPDVVEHIVLSALLNVTPVAQMTVTLRLAKALFAPETGACMCSSLSQDTVNGANNCIMCGHECHNTRTYCGALR